ncbi:MAG: YicC/YloC family endoribonuclease [Bryobacteraceae bacterium]|nr:YicC/YloC family endoribonuclease [Bryobacteraceae bacterium]
MSAPLRSMTGFARVRRQTALGEIICSLKSVNHRGLDLHFHLPASLDPFEGAVRAALKRALLRGHVDVRISLVRNGGESAGQLNRELLAAWHGAFRAASAELGLRGEPDLNEALRIPGMLGEAGEEEIEAGFEQELVAATEEAAARLNEFRAREGAEIAAEMKAHNSRVREAAERIGELRAGALPYYQQRLQERLAELLNGAGIEPQRLAQEAAILADRSDIGEETARLRIHAGELATLLSGGGEVGKRLDFLLQEMNREANTILSKTTNIGEIGLAITGRALEAKSAIEKIREQALNLE